jgi:hypothetical protein
MRVAWLPLLDGALFVDDHEAVLRRHPDAPTPIDGEGLVVARASADRALGEADAALDLAVGGDDLHALLVADHEPATVARNRMNVVIVAAPADLSIGDLGPFVPDHHEHSAALVGDEVRRIGAHLVRRQREWLPGAVGLADEAGCLRDRVDATLIVNRELELLDVAQLLGQGDVLPRRAVEAIDGGRLGRSRPQAAVGAADERAVVLGARARQRAVAGDDVEALKWQSIHGTLSRGMTMARIDVQLCPDGSRTGVIVPAWTR